MQLDAKPEDRDQIALWVQKIKTEHKPGPDGNLIAVDRIYLGKKGTALFQNVVEANRLKKDNPFLWDKVVGPAYERWLKDKTITREGLALEAWPAITEGQIDMCKSLGLHSVEDIATASDSIRQKLGMGGSKLMDLAKAFVANKDATATAAKLTALEARLAQAEKDLEEARATNDALATKRGKSARKSRAVKDEGMEEAA